MNMQVGKMYRTTKRTFWLGSNDPFPTMIAQGTLFYIIGYKDKKITGLFGETVLTAFLTFREAEKYGLFEEIHP